MPWLPTAWDFRWLFELNKIQVSHEINTKHHVNEQSWWKIQIHISSNQFNSEDKEIKKNTYDSWILLSNGVR